MGEQTVTDRHRAGYQAQTTVITARRWGHHYCCLVVTAAAAVVVVIVVDDPAAGRSSCKDFPHCWLHPHYLCNLVPVCDHAP